MTDRLSHPRTFCGDGDGEICLRFTGDATDAGHVISRDFAMLITQYYTVHLPNKYDSCTS